MERFFDRTSYRKVTLLRILSSESRVFSLNELSDYLEISKKTLVKSLSVLKDELHDNGYRTNVIEKNGQGYYLDKVDVLSIKQIEINYLKESILFQLYDEIFNGNFRDITDFSLRHYLSYTSVYNRINESQSFLEHYKLQFGFNGNSVLIGSQAQIRFFYFQFYWASYWGVEWSFSCVEREELIEIMKVIQQFKQKKMTIPEYEYTLYWIAICVSRNRSDFPVRSSEEIDQTLQGSSTFKNFKESVLPEMKKLYKSDLDSEILFLFKILFMSHGILSKGSFPMDLLLSLKSGNMQEYRLTEIWLSTFTKEYQLNLTVEQYSDLFIQLLYYHMRKANFYGDESLFIDDFKGISNREVASGVDEMMFSEFLVKLKSNIDFSEFLDATILLEVEEYYRTLIRQSVNSKEEKKKLNIVLLSSLEDTNIKYLESVIQQQTTDAIEFCSLDREADLIISDRWYKQLNESEAPVMIWESVPTLQDKQLLEKKLVEIKQVKKTVKEQ